VSEEKKANREQRALARRLSLARSKRKLTQSELGKRAGLSRAYAAHIEQCLIVQPGATVLARLARALNVPREWLVFGIGDEPMWDPVVPSEKLDPEDEGAA
jgi:transcriptional regulator with XRE-family HTH domain